MAAPIRACKVVVPMSHTRRTGWLSWIGNGIVIFIMYKQRQALEPQDYLTLNLALSDASVSIFGYSRGIIEIFNVFQDDGFLITTIWTCEVDGIFTLLFGLGSINTLTAISIIRYIKGCKPHRAYRVDKRSIMLALTFVWLTALFWSIAPLLGWGSYTDRMYGTCEIDWIQTTFSLAYKLYVVGIFLCCFFLPVSIMSFSYVSIIKMVRHSHKCARGGDVSMRQRQVEREITRVSFVICTAFILAWSPYAVISMWSACGFSTPAISSILACLLAKSASFYNPIIYFGMCPKFRKEVQALFHCLKESGDAGTMKSGNPCVDRKAPELGNKADEYLVLQIPASKSSDLKAELESDLKPNIIVTSKLKNMQKIESEHL
ncbi:opsin 6, group member b [Hypanus sabinus]|uniref:opsin 6, group member b n=1 Tax=Hypanus sabinus TaxID=79690 RepID=UPI0028C4769D|nr:opsin 6, group member b [Hypanus sabinus]